ncbi:MAG: peptide chain release factor 2 [Alphaproteobacteria bacterium]|nr:peptide chain release factor 2 [Alphaproteobacteria bacterium]
MRAETQTAVDSIKEALVLLRRHLDWDRALKRVDELEALVAAPNFWNDSGAAQQVMRERTRLTEAIAGIRSLKERLSYNRELLALAESDADAGVLAEAESALKDLQAEAEKQRSETMLSGEADGNDAFLEVHAGAGGTESQDWAQILLRMYVRWAEEHRHNIEWIEESGGEEAGIKSATIKIAGRNAYGWLKTETGVHRLVRISPYDANARRHTSFASVGVYPVIDEAITVDIQEKDLRIDTYRASGAGGQHVNRTDSAVRITHVPTGIVVQCQTDRSQHKNKSAAMSMLKARLYELELQKRDQEKQALHDSKTEIGWGHQIRSYVLHPYQMVKDLRTGVETSNTQAVLDGALDPFMEAELKARVGGVRKAVAATDD